MSGTVVIAGGGPNGLMLACELRLCGVPAIVLERLPERSEIPKANGLVGQVVQVLDARGLLQQGGLTTPAPAPYFMFGGMPLDLRRLDPNPLYTMLLPQRRLEQLLETRAHELGAEIRRGHEVTGFSQDADGVDVTVTEVDGARQDTQGTYQLRAAYLVGCDGAHSVVRKVAGIGFPGVTTADIMSRAAHVVLPANRLVPGTGELDLPVAGRLRPFMLHRTAHGVFAFATFEPGVHLVSTLEWGLPAIEDDAPLDLAEVRDSVQRVLGDDLPIVAPPGSGPFVLRRLTSRNTRQADRYRAGRVIVAGDAAHVHAAVGGPGLNLGLQDVVNLGWKLAATVQGWAPPGLLDTYHAERHPVGERVVMHTQAQAALLAPGGEVTALRTLFGELLQQEPTLRAIADLLAGTDIRYDMRRVATGSADAEMRGAPIGSGHTDQHPLLGRWAPQLSLTIADRTTGVAELLRPARPMLLDLVGDRTLATAAQGWCDRVDVVTARASTPPTAATGAAALLIRPDGYVAWVGTMDDPRRPIADGLQLALSTWFGQPTDGLYAR